MDNLVLVHLSDVHFTRASGNVHDVDQTVRDELLRDVAAVTNELGAAHGVLVTGDIAFSGKKEEYQHAAEWLRKVCEAVGCEEQKVAVVPGNHDVDRGLAADLITKLIHQTMRGLHESEIDAKLREYFTHTGSANALLAPLAQYNIFAQPYECDVSEKRPFWQRDLRLSCGTTIRMRGLCSAYVSNAEDDRNKMVLGTAYAGVPREDGVLFLTLCHHPPDWFRDQNPVEDLLKSRVHIQLFGHKHAQRVDVINDKVRLVAGATHPDRRELAWLPTYNVLEIGRRDEDSIRLRLHHRRWHQAETRFVADHDPNTGKEYREYKWAGFPRRNPSASPEVPTGVLAGSAQTVSGEVAAPAALAVDSSPNSEDDKQRLTFRFLRLPTLDRYQIALRLGLMREGDDALPPNTVFLEVFQRAVDARRLADLWDETEQRHDDRALVNPFRNSLVGE